MQSSFLHGPQRYAGSASRHPAYAFAAPGLRTSTYADPQAAETQGHRKNQVTERTKFSVSRCLCGSLALSPRRLKPALYVVPAWPVRAESSRSLRPAWESYGFAEPG